MVGSWSATNVSLNGSTDGGVGSRWTIAATGQETIDWDGSGYFSTGGQSTYRYEGEQTAVVKIVPGASGKWSSRITSAAVTAFYSSAIAEATGKKSEPIPSSAGVAESGSWSCSASTMRIVVSAEGSTIAVTLARR